MRNEIVPAVLVKSRTALKALLEKVEPFAKKVQVDIMDNKFVPNKTIDASAFKGIKTKLKLDFQLMVNNPEKHIPKYLKLKPYNITFHVEACRDIEQCIKMIKTKKVKVGLGVNPKTPFKKIKPLIDKVDLVLVMTVEPGFQGQRFKTSMLKKIRQIRRAKPSIAIQVDGGVKLTNIAKAKQAGANSFVVGSALVKQKDIKRTFESFKERIK